MTKTQAKMIQQQVEMARERFDLAISKVADKVRDEIIIPVCRSNKLEFFSGHGTWFFVTQGGNHIGDASDVEGDRLERILKPIFELLHIETEHNQCLGYFVSDVRKKDYGA